MAFLATSFGCDVGLRLLLSPISSTIISRTACVAVGVGFPVYSTFKALEHKQEQEQEQEKWLIYWTVYGCFNVVEIFSDKLLSWFPYYYHAKLALMIWLQLPISDGARYCFMHHVRPFFMKHEVILDRVVYGAQNAITNFVVSHQNEIELLQHGAQKLMKSVQHSFLGPSSSSSNQPRLDRSPAPVADDVPDAEGDDMVPVDTRN